MLGFSTPISQLRQRAAQALATLPRKLRQLRGGGTAIHSSRTEARQSQIQTAREMMSSLSIQVSTEADSKSYTSSGQRRAPWIQDQS
jgi:hypothetical protein